MKIRGEKKKSNKRIFVNNFLLLLSLKMKIKQKFNSKVVSKEVQMEKH